MQLFSNIHFLIFLFLFLFLFFLAGEGEFGNLPTWKWKRASQITCPLSSLQILPAIIIFATYKECH